MQVLEKINKLYERFGEHRRSIENPHHLSCPTKGMQLIPLELIRNSSRDSVRKARVALIDKAKRLEPLGNNRRDELH